MQAGPPGRTDQTRWRCSRSVTAACAELVPIRVGRMLVSPFTFLRGAAEVMAHDLAQTPTHRRPGAGVRRRSSPQLRRVRDARAPPRVRRERLRRDAARSVGMGCEAARGAASRSRRAAVSDDPGVPSGRRCAGWCSHTANGWGNSRSWRRSTSGTSGSTSKRVLELAPGSRRTSSLDGRARRANGLGITPA